MKARPPVQPPLAKPPMYELCGSRPKTSLNRSGEESLPLDQAPQALAKLADRSTVGKVVLVP